MNMIQIDVKTETEHSRGWAFDVALDDNGTIYDFVVQLSFVDYDLWSHGQVAPEKVVAAAFRFLLDNEPITSIMQKFDCAVIRRYFKDADDKLPGYLNGASGSGIG